MEWVESTPYVNHCQALINRIRHLREIGRATGAADTQKANSNPTLCNAVGYLLGLMDTCDVILTVIACCFESLSESEVFLSLSFLQQLLSPLRFQEFLCGRDNRIA